MGNISYAEKLEKFVFLAYFFYTQLMCFCQMYFSNIFAFIAVDIKEYDSNYLRNMQNNDVEPG
jgi:hypothetical protein